MNETHSNTFVAWVQATPLRKALASTIFVFIALALIAKTVLLFKQASHVGQGDDYPQSVVVAGKAEEYVKPDTLQFTISVNEEGKDVREATTKSSAKIAEAIKILKANGVDEKNIKTTSYSVTDKYDSVSAPCTYEPMAPGVKTISFPPCTNTTSKIVGSIVYQTLEVKIQDIEKNATTEARGKIVGELAAANLKTDGFTFTIFDIDAVKARVRGEAIKNAKEDAKLLSKNLGVRLSDIAGFSEQDGGYQPFMSARADMAVAKEGGIAVPSVALPSGEQKVTSNIFLTYLIK